MKPQRIKVTAYIVALNSGGKIIYTVSSYPLNSDGFVTVKALELETEVEDPRLKIVEGLEARIKAAEVESSVKVRNIRHQISQLLALEMEDTNVGDGQGS